MRKVTVEMKVKIVMKVNDGVEVEYILDEIQLNLPDTADLDDSEILDYEVKDSR